MLSLGQATFGRCSRVIPQKLLCWTRKQWTMVDITHFIQTVVTFRGIKKFYDKSNTPLPKDSYSWETKYYRGWSFRSFLKVSKPFQNIFRKQFLCWYGQLWISGEELGNPTRRLIFSCLSSDTHTGTMLTKLWNKIPLFHLHFQLQVKLGQKWD